MADDYAQTLMMLIQDYWWIGAIAILLIVILYFFKQQPKNQLKAVNRAEIERQLFINRMSFNDSPYKFMEVAGKKKYRIQKFQASEKDGVKVFEFVMKPLMLGIVPIGKPYGYIFKADHFEYDNAKPNTIMLKPGITTWSRLGVFFDNTFSKDNITFFSRDYSAQTDLENTLSMTYSAAQEQSVIDPNRAHATLDRHLEIERIKEERKKQQLGT